MVRAWFFILRTQGFLFGRTLASVSQKTGIDN